MSNIYYKSCRFLCLSVCLYPPPPPFFDTTVGLQPNLAHIFGYRYGTHSELKKNNLPTPPQRGPVGGFRGSKNQKSGKCHELPRKSIKQLLKKNPVGVGWGGNFSGQKIKSPGNVMNCPENPQKFKTRWGGVGWGGSFRGSKNKKSWKCHELPRKSIKKI